MAKPIKYSTPAGYRIRLKEQLDDTWSDWFENLELSTENGETILSGQVTDQAALHGLFTQIRDLNLTLLSVEQIEPDPENKN